MKFFTPSTNRLLVVIGFLGLLVLIVWWNAGVPKPREGDRVGSLRHAFSIIHPPDWDVESRTGDANSLYAQTITTSPKKSVGRETRLFAGELSQPQDVATLTSAGYRPITLDGQPAFGRGLKNKHDFSYAALIPRDGRWFEVSIRLPTEDDVPASDWWAYFQTLRVEPLPATAPATMPGT